jgi:hypothetical protein
MNCFAFIAQALTVLLLWVFELFVADIGGIFAWQMLGL